MSKWRRYLYLPLEMDHNTKKYVHDTSYPLRRIDASKLFFPANHHPMIAATSSSLMEEGRLLPPCHSFTTTNVVNRSGSMFANFFALFGRGNDKKNKSLIAGVDDDGFTVIYDLDRRDTVHQHNRLRLNEHKGNYAVSLAVGDALYVIDRSPESSGCFEALVHGNDQEQDDCWHWRCLEPPPFLLQNHDNDDPDDNYSPTVHITAHNVVGGSDIWISSSSTAGISTYSFATTTGAWSKVGDWALPFHGRAEYFPEYNAWLGFFSRNNNNLLCAWDITTEPTNIKLHNVLEEEENSMPVESKGLTASYLVHLGSGKFCVARFFERQYYDMPAGWRPYYGSRATIENSVVFTGYVMDDDLLLPGEPAAGKLLRMTKHKSRLYVIGEGMSDAWVF